MSSRHSAQTCERGLSRPCTSTATTARATASDDASLASSVQALTPANQDRSSDDTATEESILQLDAQPPPADPAGDSADELGDLDARGAQFCSPPTSESKGDAGSGREQNQWSYGDLVYWEQRYAKEVTPGSTAPPYFDWCAHTRPRNAPEMSSSDAEAKTVGCGL